MGSLEIPGALGSRSVGRVLQHEVAFQNRHVVSLSLGTDQCDFRASITSARVVGISFSNSRQRQAQARRATITLDDVNPAPATPVWAGPGPRPGNRSALLCAPSVCLFCTQSQTPNQRLVSGLTICQKYDSMPDADGARIYFRRIPRSGSAPHVACRIRSNPRTGVRSWVSRSGMMPPRTKLVPGIFYPTMPTQTAALFLV